MSSIYVLSTIGASPSVLTELLWWLSARQGRPIAGIEAWATGEGAEQLRQLVATPEWSALKKHTGPLPDPQPEGAEPDTSYGFRIHCFAHDGEVLNDVRTRDEAAAVSATLHDRVRTLRAGLASHIELVGCLAGGRKTVSAALQTAFCLQAGPTDRLVHALFDPTFEQALRDHGRRGDYAFPSETWAELTGIPVEDQSTLYEVPFPRLRYLVPRRLSDAIQRLPWHDVWPALDANMGRHARAVLRRKSPRAWIYEVVDTDTALVLYETELKGRKGAMLAAMAGTPDEVSARGLVAWLDQHEVGWAPTRGRGADEESREAAIRSAATAVRKHLDDIPVGLERFVPEESGFSLPDVELIGLPT